MSDLFDLDLGTEAPGTPIGLPAPLRVSVGEMAVSATPCETLVAIGLGSCVGVALFERRSFGRELEPDPVVYLTIGNEVLHGAVPYRDLFDHKGPLTYWIYAGLNLLLPSSYSAVRLAL